jgi:hypothetical protein
MNHDKPSGGFLELRLGPKGPHVRHDLSQAAVTILFRDAEAWSLDARQHRVADNLIHFLAPDGQLLGIKCFAGGRGHE